MAAAKQKTAQNALILKYHRLMDAFAKSDDERDFFLDRAEGFMLYADLSMGQEELDLLEAEVKNNAERYCTLPKLTYYETKKIMEGFVNEKVYDIDTKEKLADIIQSKDAREHFLEFIYDNLTELEKWQQYYQERSRIRIIEWLRNNSLDFVFEEDLELPKAMIENLKKSLFQVKASKDLASARLALKNKAKTYYSNEALNPRPKRGRPPKQVVKVEVEPEYTMDIYATVPQGLRSFLYTPDISSAASVTFSAKFANEEELRASLKTSVRSQSTEELEALSKRLESLQTLSTRLAEAKVDIPKDKSGNKKETSATKKRLSPLKKKPKADES